MGDETISERAQLKSGLRPLPGYQPAGEKEWTPRPAKGEIITEDEVGRCITWMAKTASEYGLLLEKKIFADEYLSHLEAILKLGSDEKTDVARKDAARASQKYLAAIRDKAVTAGKFMTMHALRTTAETKISVYQTQQADNRRGTMIR